MPTQKESPICTRVGPLEIDVGRAAGYYGALAVGVGLDLIAPPLALFIAAVPLFKMLQRPKATLTERAVSEVLDGATKPVGGDSSAVIRRVVTDPHPRPAKLWAGPPEAIDAVLGAAVRETKGIWTEAHRLAHARV